MTNPFLSARVFSQNWDCTQIFSIHTNIIVYCKTHREAEIGGSSPKNIVVYTNQTQQKSKTFLKTPTPRRPPPPPPPPTNNACLSSLCVAGRCFACNGFQEGQSQCRRQQKAFSSVFVLFSLVYTICCSCTSTHCITSKINYRSSNFYFLLTKLKSACDKKVH